MIAVKRNSMRYRLCILTTKGQNIPKKDQYWIFEKNKHNLTFPTLKDVFNGRNLDILRIRVKVKLFVLDVVKKDTM